MTELPKHHSDHIDHPFIYSLPNSRISPEVRGKFVDYAFRFHDWLEITQVVPSHLFFIARDPLTDVEYRSYFGHGTNRENVFSLREEYSHSRYADDINYHYILQMGEAPNQYSSLSFSYYLSIQLSEGKQNLAIDYDVNGMLDNVCLTRNINGRDQMTFFTTNTLSQLGKFRFDEENIAGGNKKLIRPNSGDSTDIIVVPEVIDLKEVKLRFLHPETENNTLWAPVEHDDSWRKTSIKKTLGIIWHRPPMNP